MVVTSVFTTWPEDGYGGLRTYDPEMPLDVVSPLMLSRTSVATVWPAVHVYVVTRDLNSGEPLLVPAMPFMSFVDLVLCNEQIELIGPLLEPFGELLPLLCDTAELCAFHCLNSRDVLDIERSRPLYSPSDGRLIRVGQKVVRPEAMEPTEVVRPQVGEVLFGEELVRAIMGRTETAGTSFSAVWDVDRGPLMPPERFLLDACDGLDEE